MTTFRIDRECANCGETAGIVVSKREAAFELFDLNELLGKKCSHCFKNKFITHYYHPDLDLELLEEWATNEDLYLMEQDEELFLADEKYVSIILEVLDSKAILPQKKGLLIEALCILIYDNLKSKNPNIHLRELVVNEINKRIEKVKLSEEWISTYISDVVFPLLNFSK